MTEVQINWHWDGGLCSVLKTVTVTALITVMCSKKSENGRAFRKRSERAREKQTESEIEKTKVKTKSRVPVQLQNHFQLNCFAWANCIYECYVVCVRVCDSCVAMISSLKFAFVYHIRHAFQFLLLLSLLISSCTLSHWMIVTSVWLPQNLWYVVCIGENCCLCHRVRLAYFFVCFWVNGFECKIYQLIGCLYPI